MWLAINAGGGINVSAPMPRVAAESRAPNPLESDGLFLGMTLNCGAFTVTTALQGEEGGDGSSSEGSQTIGGS